MGYEEIEVDVYYKLPGGKLSHYSVKYPSRSMEETINACRKAVDDTLPNSYNLAVLAVVPGGKY